MTSSVNKPIMTPATVSTSLAILAAVEKSNTLAVISKKNYLGNLSLLTKNISRKKDCWAAIIDHKYTINALKARFEGRNASLAAYAAAVLSSFKIMPALKETAPAAYAAWAAVNVDAKKVLEDRVLTSAPTPRQAAGMVPWADIVSMRHSLRAGSQERVLLACYVDLPCPRNDLGELQVYTTPPVEPAGNYIVLPLTKEPATMHLTSFKTDKKYGEITHTLPESLVEDIKASMSIFPRDNLFFTVKMRPYSGPSVFGKWANATLKCLFGKPLTLTGVRHSFLSSLDWNTMTGQQRLDLSQKMGHSVATQGAYKWIIP